MNDFILTLDVDWAPDFIIEHIAKILVSQKVKATWFITHASPALDFLRSNSELFELGIHPNFLPNSTQGTNPDEVLKYCMALVPEAISMRTHAGVQSIPLLNKIMTSTPISLDSSIYLPHIEDIQPISYWSQEKELLRIPIFWEDDLEMERPDGCWTLEALTHFKGGLKVFDFHLIHIYLNSREMIQYQKLRRDRVPLPLFTPSELPLGSLLKQASGSLFLEIVDCLAKCGSSGCLCDLAKGTKQ